MFISFKQLLYYQNIQLFFRNNLFIISIAMSAQFPMEQFRDAFKITAKIKNKLQPFIAEFKNQNMLWIITALQEIHKYLFDDKIAIADRFNSIFGIKFIFDTAEVILVNLIEEYFLPKMLQIASFEPKTSEDKRGYNYFVSQGYSKDNPETQKFGYNFVRMASEFIWAAAQIKVNKLYAFDETEEPSQYYQAYLKLQELGWKPYQAPAYYKQPQIDATKTLYLKNLETYDQIIDPFINYYSDIFNAYLEKGIKHTGRLNPNKMLQSGDVNITTPVLQLCLQALHKLPLKQKTIALRLLNDFIRWADIQAAFNVNCTPILDQYIKQIANPTVTNTTLSRGRNLFKNQDCSEEVRQQFYIQLLKCIQFWSLCYPNAIKSSEKQKDSKIKFYHQQLRMKLKIEFPQDKNLQQDKSQFDRNFTNKEKRNEELLNQMEGDDPQNDSLVTTNKSEQKLPQKLQTPMPDGSDYDKINNNIEEVEKCIETLSESQSKIDAKIQTIKKFNTDFDSKITTANIQDQQLTTLLERGTPLTDKIETILPHLIEYQTKKINFEQLIAILNPKSSPKKQARPQQKESIKSIKLQQRSQPVRQTKAQQVDKKVFQSQQKMLAQQVKVEAKPEVKASKPISERQLNKLNQNTPIKRMNQSRQRFSDDNSMSSLPNQSKLVKQYNQHQVSSKPSIKNQQNQKISIQPASHHPASIRKSQSRGIMNQKLLKEKAELSQKIVQTNKLIKLPANSIKSIKNAPVNSIRSINVPSGSIKDKNLNKVNRNNELSEQLIQEDTDQHPINKVKYLNNAAGSYKFKSEESRLRQLNQITPKNNQNNLKGSNVSRKTEKINFQQSKVYPVNIQQDDDDMIFMPQNNPLELSFHQIIGIEDQVKNNKQLSFKKCFQAEKHLLGTDKSSMMFWLEKDTDNLIKTCSSQVRKHSRNKDSTLSIPSILNQKNKRHQEELKYVEEQKNRKIRQLENKVKNLQNEGSRMKQKLVQQDKQIKSFKAQSSVDYSRVVKNNYYEDQDLLFKTKLNAQRPAKDRSFFEQSLPKSPKYLDPKGTLLNTRKFNDFFQAFKDQKKKKNLLKSKQLLYKDDLIEFGSMCKKSNKSLVVTLFITPERDLQGLTYAIKPIAYTDLTIEISPKNIPSIRKRKQQKINIQISIQTLPYHLPNIQFVYSIQSKIYSQTFVVPCAFHKFIHLETADAFEIQKQFENGKNVIRGEEVPYSKKILKNIASLTEYFPNGTFFRGGQPNQNGEVQFGGQAEWKNERFYIRIMVKPSQFLYVQAASDKQSETIEFYVSLITNLLMKNLELLEIK